MSENKTNGHPVRRATGVSMDRLPSILLVDDQLARLLTYEAILAGLNVLCVRATSGHDALRRLMTQDFAAIILDVNMPAMDGFEVARLLREYPRIERTPIIFVTGINVSERDHLKGYEVGAIDYISVPVVPEILRSKVAILVELYQRRSKLQMLNRALAEARAQLDRDHASALAASRAQFTAIFEHPTEATVVLEAQRDGCGTIDDWIYRSANSNAVRNLGRKAEAVLGQRVSALEPARAPIIIATCAKVLLTGTFASYDTRYGHIDYAIMIYPAGKDTVVLSGLDITERKNTEAALQASERRYRALVEATPVGVSHNAIDGRFEYVNRTFCQLLGYSAEELGRRTWQEVTHPDDLNKDTALAKAVIAGKIPHYSIEKRYIRKDGSIIWVSLFGTFVLDGEGHAQQGLAVVIDITERRHAEAERVHANIALTRSEEHFRSIFQETGIGMVLIERDCTMRMANSAFCRIVGRPEEALLGTSCLSITHPADVDDNFRLIGRLLDGPDHAASYEKRYVRPDGSSRWVRINIVRYAAEGAGLPERLLAAVEDITERIEAREALEEAHRERQFLLEAERTARNEAESAMRAKDEFLATLSHELRTPLSNIVSWARVLQRKYAMEHAELAKGLKIIVDNAMAQGQLISDLLDMSRIVAGKISLETSTLDVGDLVTRAANAQRPAAEAKGLSIEIEPNIEVAFVLGDEVRLQQVLWNVLSNAIKFTPAGSQSPIRVTTQRLQNHHLISVSDPGEGIDPGFLPYIFGRFRQSDGSRARRHGGLGLGLAIVKQLAEMHGGRVSVYSAGVGQGAKFTISLPAYEADVRSPVVAVGEEVDLRDGQPLVGHTILVVEDQPSILEHLKQCLEEHGATAICVSSADAALKALQGHKSAPVALLLSDLGLPEMDGYQLIRTIRDELRLTAEMLPAIAVSAFARDEDRARSIVHGYQAHIIKPYHATQIVTTAAGLLARYTGKMR